MIRNSLARSLVLAALSITPLWLALPETAQATTIADLSVEQMTDGSTYIVRGTVTRVWVETDAKGQDWTRAELAVSHTFKGPDSPDTLIIDSIGSSEQPYFSMARYSEGEEMLVFLDTVAGGRFTPVAANHGKLTLRRPPNEDRKIAVRYEVNPSTRYDARFLPVPPRADWQFADDIEAQISARVAAGWDGKAVPGASLEKLRSLNTPERRAH